MNKSAGSCGFRADYPGNVERGVVCIYFKESLSIRFLDISSNLDESLLCELSYGNKKCFIATLYRSPSQSLEEFEFFFSNFQPKNLHNNG